jgi:hypothetical protein
MKTYFYSGPVMEFERIIANRWSGSTRAVSEKKARCNLAHQFKMEHGREPRSKITIPGKITTIEGDETHNGRDRSVQTV